MAQAEAGKRAELSEPEGRVFRAPPKLKASAGLPRRRAERARAGACPASVHKPQNPKTPFAIYERKRTYEL